MLMLLWSQNHTQKTAGLTEAELLGGPRAPKPAKPGTGPGRSGCSLKGRCGQMVTSGSPGVGRNPSLGRREGRQLHLRVWGKIPAVGRFLWLPWAAGDAMADV